LSIFGCKKIETEKSFSGCKGSNMATEKLNFCNRFFWFWRFPVLVLEIGSQKKATDFVDFCSNFGSGSTLGASFIVFES